MISSLRQKALAWLVQLPKGQQALVQAACDSEANARVAWRAWLSTHDIDAADWQDHKLLALIAQRLGYIDPDNPLRGRLRGLSKMHWTLSQLSVREALDAVDALLRADMDVMLLKGAALDASGLCLPGPRISGDLDILVRRGDFARSLQTLIDHGWQMKNRSLKVEMVERIRPGMNLYRGEQGDIDVHHQPIHAPMLSDGQLAELWSRAQQLEWLGRKIFVPSLEDQFLINAVHACRSSAKAPSSPLWPINLSILAQSGKLDFDVIAKHGRGWTAGACLEAATAHVRSLPDQARRCVLAQRPSVLSVLLLLAARMGTLPRTLLLACVKILAPRVKFFELPNAAYYVRRWLSKRLRYVTR